MYRMAFLALCALTLASCANGPGGTGPLSDTASEAPAPSGAAFDAQDFAWSARPGSGVIYGTVAYHRSSARYSCSGSDVLLTPESPWSRRRMVILYGSANAAAAPVSIVRARTPTAGAGDYARFVRRTSCDATDHFSFHDLPDGSWFVITIVKPVDGVGEAMAVTRRVQTHGGGVVATLS
jgi:hypothetical protein